MITRSTIRGFAAALATATLLAAAASAADAAVRAPTHGAAPVSSTTTANPQWGRGYGRGWCYWHPYACYRVQSTTSL